MSKNKDILNELFIRECYQTYIKLHQWLKKCLYGVV